MPRKGKAWPTKPRCPKCKAGTLRYLHDDIAEKLGYYPDSVVQAVCDRCGFELLDKDLRK